MVGLLLSSSAHKQDSHPVFPTLLMDFFCVVFDCFEQSWNYHSGFFELTVLFLQTDAPTAFIFHAVTSTAVLYLYFFFESRATLKL